MKNKIEDLRNHLFQQLERLNDDEAMKNPIKRDAELKKAKAIADIGQVIVNSAKVEVEAMNKLNIGGSDFIPDGKRRIAADSKETNK